MIRHGNRHHRTPSSMSLVFATLLLTAMPACRESDSSSSTLRAGADAPPMWTPVATGTYGATSWRYEVEAGAEGKLCMRFAAETTTGSTRRPFTGISPCLVLQRGEHLVHASSGEVPGSGLRYLFGLTSQEVDAVEADTSAHRQPEVHLGFGSYVLVLPVEQSLIRLTALDDGEVVAVCEFGDDETGC